MADATAGSPAAPHEPPYSFTANQGYGNQVDDVPSEIRMPVGAPNEPAHSEDGQDDIYYEDDEDEEDDLDSIEDYADDEVSGLASGGADLTKSYNRQRQLATASSSTAAAVAAPPSNRQRPEANTLSRVDDQVSALSKHAAKIRLDSVKLDDDRIKDKADRATSDQVLDQRTRRILLQMINRGYVSEIEGAISTGKEANVYGAMLVDDTGTTHRAIKVYKTAILVFKDRERYITGEHRFKGGYNKGNNRGMVKLWAEKEFRNLRRIHNAGIPCPKPVFLKLHVLVMGFLGDRKGRAYSKLRDASIEGDDAEERWRALYIQLVCIMRKMYQVCRLVHADLSEYNILHHDGTLYIIDVSQSVEPDHPRSLEFLRMDVKNVGDFFRRKGVCLLPERAVFHFITDAAGPVEGPAASEAFGRLLETHSSTAPGDAQADDVVFRNQYIPQTLQQVYDMETDAQKLTRGEGQDLVYKDLLADQVVGAKEDLQRPDGLPSADAASDSESDDGSVAGSSDSETDDESRFDKGQPRGRRFKDKEEKKLHKEAVKEAKREKRREKMPKHVKKKMVSSTSRRKNHK